MSCFNLLLLQASTLPRFRYFVDISNNTSITIFKKNIISSSSKGKTIQFSF